jgi:hypothetical protein
MGLSWVRTDTAVRVTCPLGDRDSSETSDLQGESNLIPPEVTPPCQEHNKCEPANIKRPFEYVTRRLSRNGSSGGS